MKVNVNHSCGGREDETTKSNQESVRRENSVQVGNSLGMMRNLCRIRISHLFMDQGSSQDVLEALRQEALSTLVMHKL